MGYYRQIVIELFYAWGETSARKIRARPLPGQGFPTDMRVNFSLKARGDYSVGTKLLVMAQEIDSPLKPCLYVRRDAPLRVVTNAQAQAIIEELNK
jgi:hypothetical protein